MTPTTVVIVTWQGEDLLPACLEALRPEVEGRAQVLVVDNASTDGTAAVLAATPWVRVLRLPENRGFAGGVAAALDAVGTPYAVLLNDDARVDPGWLGPLVAPLDADPTVAAVTSKVLLDRPGPPVVNSVGVELTADAYGRDRGWAEEDRGQYDRPEEVFGASGCSVALRLSAVRAVGGVDASYFLYYEDTDLCWRLRLAGHRVLTAPASTVRHAHSATAGSRSDLHRFHDERNRLLTLVKDASAGLAAKEVLRHPLTTASLRWRRGAPEAEVRVRARAYRGFLRRLPAALRARRRLRPVVPRRAVERAWRPPPGTG